MEPSFVQIHLVAVVRALQGTIQHHLYGLSGPSAGYVAGVAGGICPKVCISTVGSVAASTNSPVHVYRVSCSNSVFVRVSHPL